jgi:hypothetical protein
VNRTSFPKAELRHPALPRAGGVSVVAAESAGDRILLTLLALGLMLLAFFVVLTTAGKLDERRIRDVAKSVQMSFERASENTGTSRVPSEGAASQRAGVAALRAAVANIFADVINSDQTIATDTTSRPNADRVEVDVPLALFFDGQGALNPLPLLDRIVAVMGVAPPGYRMELFARATVARGEMAHVQTQLAQLADGLVQRGLGPTMLSVGAQQAGEIGPGYIGTLRFSFLMLESGDESATARMMGVP